MPQGDQVFFDTEFHNIGNIIRPISIGLVRVDGVELNLLMPQRVLDEAIASANADPDPFVRDTCLKDEYLKAHEFVQFETMVETRNEVTKFCGQSPIFWAYITSYDAVVLKSGLYGRIIDAPRSWPYAVNDMAVPLAMAGLRNKAFPVREDELPEHNALADARWNRRVWLEMRERALANAYGDRSPLVLATLDMRLR